MTRTMHTKMLRLSRIRASLTPPLSTSPCHNTALSQRRRGFSTQQATTSTITSTAQQQHSSSAARSPAIHAPQNWVPTPYVTETIGGGWRTHDIFSRLLMERIICLNGAVDESVSASIVAQLLFLEADAPERPISLYINTPGGSVTAGLAIYDTMTYITSPVSTTCVGQAASMGSLLLCGGAKGTRACLPHSSVMVHQPSGGYFGQASDIAIHAKEILRVREQLNGIYKRHLTKEYSLEEIEKMMERDRFMGAEEALEVGIIDKILVRRNDKGEEKA